MARAWSVGVCLAGFASALLAGCTNQRAEDARYAQTALVGLPRDTLLSCAGVPDRMTNSGAREFFTYTSEAVSGSGGGVYPSFGFYSGGFGRGFGTGLGFGFPLGGGYDVRRSACQTTFTIDNGRVSQITYGDPQGNGDIGQCYQVVQNCLQNAQSLPPATSAPASPGATSAIPGAPPAARAPMRTP
ncbi:MAG TPA: hypothetical protein VEY95_05460 [Azospirillaceae bacterium]|nr:hypothetical protein [Azospirillaceae bacterium]